MNRSLKRLALVLLCGAGLSLTGCDDVAVYGSMTMGSSWGGYGGSYGYRGYGGSPHMGSSVTISGRLR